jgi:heat shock protein HslJ
MIRPLTIVAASFLLLACKTTAGEPEAGEFSDIVWFVTAIDGAAPVKVGAPTLLFNNKGSVSGRGSCNSWGASYEVKGTKIDIRNIFSTKMACIGPAGEEEMKFFDALEAVDAIAVDGDALLLSEAGKVRIRTRRE